MPRMKIYVIGDEEIVIMMGLLGIDGTIIEKNTDFLKEFNKVIKNESFGLLIIATNLSDDQIQFIIDFKLNNIRPLVYLLPNIFGEDQEGTKILSRLHLQNII